MSDDTSWIVWLTADGAEAFLGTPPLNDSRFCVLGAFLTDAHNGVGFWMDVDFVSEVRIPTNEIIQSLTVLPSSCLVLWHYVAYVQRGERSESIGFTQAKSK